MKSILRIINSHFLFLSFRIHFMIPFMVEQKLDLLFFSIFTVRVTVRKRKTVIQNYIMLVT